MKIFISWSGERARIAALALKEWIPFVIAYVDIWMSEEDLQPGSRWGLELARKLETTNFGILCITPESLNSTWIPFEAGALAKALEGSFVCPFLIDLDPKDISASLSQFNAVTIGKHGTYQLIRSVNEALSKSSGFSIPEERLKSIFEKWWPDLEKQFNEIPPAHAGSTILVPDINNMGIEYVYESRGPALEQFSEFLYEEIERSKDDESALIQTVGTSLRGFLIPAETHFDGKDIIKKAVDNKCPLKILFTDPGLADIRAVQEGRDKGEIPSDIKQSVCQLAVLGVQKKQIKYYPGNPTVFGVATSERMLLNPYPYESESHRCFSLIVRKTKYGRDIYHQYKEYHFDKPWEHAKEIPEQDWKENKKLTKCSSGRKKARR